jgi:MarR-like DNA-binding transcriptional regulator SgrR of sgrS sRNA
MLTDALQIELLKHAPTFRRQVSAGLLSVGLERWKAVTATLTALEQAAQKEPLTPEQAVTQVLARAEQFFLDATLAKQGVRLTGNSVFGNNPGGDADTEIDRLIDQLFARGDWVWTVADWLAKQSLAQHTINGQILALLSEMAAAPSTQL